MSLIYIIILFIILNSIVSFIIVDPVVISVLFKTLFTDYGPIYIKTCLEIEGIFLSAFAVNIISVICFIFTIPCITAYIIINSHKYDYPLYNQFITLIRNPLLLPDIECAFTSGLNTAENSLQLFTTLQNKLYWNNMFIKNKINTPLIVGYIENGLIKMNGDYNETDNYIIKPIVGGLGKGIANYDKNSIPSSGSYIIQKKIVQSDVRGHFRIISVYDKIKNVYIISNIYLCMNASNDVIASNNHNGGKCNEVDIKNNSIRYMKDINKSAELSNIVPLELLDNALDSAILLHKTLPKYVISLGWDVMIADNTYYFLEGNVPHSTVFKDDVFFYQKALLINSLIRPSVI
jgi:hypothetical protein